MTIERNKALKIRRIVFSGVGMLTLAAALVAAPLDFDVKSLLGGKLTQAQAFADGDGGGNDGGNDGGGNDNGGNDNGGNDNGGNDNSNNDNGGNDSSSQDGADSPDAADGQSDNSSDSSPDLEHFAMGAGYSASIGANGVTTFTGGTSTVTYDPANGGSWSVDGGTPSATPPAGFGYNP